MGFFPQITLKGLDRCWAVMEISTGQQRWPRPGSYIAQWSASHEERVAVMQQHAMTVPAPSSQGFEESWH